MRRAAGWVVAAVCLVLAVPTLVLIALGTGTTTPPDGFGLTGLGGTAFLFAFLVYAVVGALIVSRAPGNLVAWLFCVIGVAGSVGNLAFQYADYALFVSPGALPGGVTMAWLQNLGIPPAFGLLALAVLLFPDGRLPSRRWWPAAAVAGTGTAFILFSYPVQSGPFDYPFESVDNPYGVPALLPLVKALGVAGWPLMSVGVLLGGISLVSRLRRSSGVQRQQLKWIALAGACAGVLLVVNAVSFLLSVQGIDAIRILLLGLTFASLPLAAGIAMLRHRLYDVDLAINRALVYGALTVTLAVAYLGAVLLLQRVLGGVTSDNELATVVSTLLVAALSQPARRRIQSAVDRRFYRSRYDANRTLGRFGAQVRDEVDLDELGTQLRLVVAETMQPAFVSLWLSSPGPARR